MITAKNYAAQAEKFLREDLRAYVTARDYSSLMNQFVDEIKHCVHFALPDTGSIFDNDKKGIRGEKVRLPFPKITIEYYCPDIEEKDEDSVWASKRLVYAQEVMTKDLREKIEAAKVDQQDIVRRAVSNFEDEDTWIIVRAAVFYPHLNMWHPDVIGWVMPSSWDQEIFHNLVPITDRGTDYSDGESRMHGFPVSLCPDMLEQSQNVDDKDALECAMKDIASEVSAVLELCEALSCSNVHHEIIEPVNHAVNQRRVRNGKVPMYETRTLWIDVPGADKGSSEWQGGTHRSPRQHLRRGHIRNLQSGKKVWVNATIVGAKESGFIHKTYGVKQAETV